MFTDAPIPESQTPEFSIIIAVYNDWAPLERCLRSIDQQTHCPTFEVIVVDDGSDQSAPSSVRHESRRYPVTVVRQEHAGIATARNRGIQESVGRMLLFTDADCRLHPECLSSLANTLIHHPEQKCFQLRLVGDCSNLVGKSEELRLVELQKHTMEPNGSIRYLNTAGFAVRRERLPAGGELFEQATLRAEDTLLLASLIQDRELPFFVADATIQHALSLSLSECFSKAVRSAWLEGKTFEMIARKGVQIRMSYKDRISMLRSTWKTAGARSIGRRAWFVLVARQSIERVVTFVYNLSRIGRRLALGRQP